MEDRGRCTLLNLEEDGMEVLRVLVLRRSDTSAKTLGAFGFKTASGPDLAFVDVLAWVISRLTFSFAKASLSPASDFDVSAENPSRREEVEEASDDRGRGAGSETDLIVGRSSSFQSTSILVEAPSGVVNDLGT
jgi:hypothetical protein